MKKIFLIILSIFIIIFILTNLLFFKENKQGNIYEKYPFYKKENIDRYIKYQNTNSNLNTKDIIIRVNLNLDQPDYTNISKSKYLNNKNILVNKHIYLPNDYIPTDLVKINPKYTVSDKYLTKEANNSLEKMVNDLKKDNLNLRVISAYRSYSYQENLYNQYVLKDGTFKADTYSARPGYSEHQTGLVIDVDNIKTDYEHFHETEEYIWMKNNSYKYGYILRYPKGKENITTYQYESWHYRYVGIETATYIHQNNISFDEYYAIFLDE